MNKIPFPSPLGENKSGKLDSLNRQPNERAFNENYTPFIRSMRILLPLTALSIIAVLFSWNILKSDKIVPAKTTPQAKASNVKNELLNPRFDSLDDKNQPYTITAARALQGTNEEPVLLESPMADIILKNGNWLAIQSDQGIYRQKNENLLLKKNVRLFYDQGFTFNTEELDIDIRAGTAKTDLKVTGYGPSGRINASGIYADSQKELLQFKGPSKLIIYNINNKNKDQASR